MILLRIQRVLCVISSLPWPFATKRKESPILSDSPWPSVTQLRTAACARLNLQETSLLVVQTLESAKLRDNDLSS